MRKSVPAGYCVPEGQGCNARGTAGQEAPEPANFGKSPDMCGETGENGVSGAGPQKRNGEPYAIGTKHLEMCEENGKNIGKVPGMCKESGRWNTDEGKGPKTYLEVGAGEGKTPGTCCKNGASGVANDKGAGRCDKDGSAAGVFEGAPASALRPDIKTVSTAALAYLGDAVIEVLVRERLVAKGLSSSKALNREALDFVRAPAQAAAMERLFPFLTPEEAAVFRRGRNTGHTNTPKNATVAEYRSATGMEALFGYLYLSGNTARAAELFVLAYQREDLA